MARLYSNENLPFRVVQELRRLGHDVLTSLEAGNANRGVPDEDVLAFAITDGRAVLTLNRRDFIALHLRSPGHAGIIVCTRDVDVMRQAEAIHLTIEHCGPLAGMLLRVTRPIA